MKLKITLILVGFITSLGFSQEKMFDLLQEKSKTKILYDRVFGISNATKEYKKPLNSTHYNQVYHEIQRADFLKRLPSYDVLKEEAKLASVKNYIPLSILIADFESIATESINNKDLFLNTNNQIDVKENAKNIFEEHHLNLIAPMVSKSKKATFILNDNFIFNTTTKIISAVYIKTSNEKNWQKINYNKSFDLNFNNIGKQQIETKIEFSNAEAIIQSFEIELTENTTTSKKNVNSQTFSPNVVNNISSTIPYQGYGETAAFLGQGEYELYLDTVDGVLDKPIFLLDGFDPGDARSTSAIYSFLNYGTTGGNLGDEVRAQGYDIILLNFPTYTRPSTTTVIDGGVDYIQRNAMILVELINQINAQKVGTAKNVVIGPSMGGLISRYALRYMETHSMNHDTRLYISFDSPHQGANVPIGFQHLFNYMAYGPLGSTSVQPIVDGMLKSPAAKEMLIDHFEGHLQTGSATEFNTAAASLLPTGCPNYRTTFQNELNTMGFPQLTRNISIANGAGNGAMNYTPNQLVMGHTFNTSSTQRAIIDLRFTPTTNTSNQVSRFRGQQWIIFWATFYESLANSKAPTFTAGLDSAPGGKFDMSTLQAGAGGDPLLTEFFDNLQVDYFTFIPTWSSMAISSSTNLYANVTSSSTTPFVASSIPTANENHVTLTATNVAFALNEILNPALNNSNFLLENIFVKNPVGNSIEIYSNYSLENVSITITDVLGKTIYSKDNLMMNEMLEIPISLSKGIYMLTLSSDKGKTTKKLIKN